MIWFEKTIPRLRRRAEGSDILTINCYRHQTAEKTIFRWEARCKWNGELNKSCLSQRLLTDLKSIRYELLRFFCNHLFSHATPKNRSNWLTVPWSVNIKFPLKNELNYQSLDMLHCISAVRERRTVAATSRAYSFPKYRCLRPFLPLTEKPI